MRIEKICEYLNEIGIIDIKSINIFLTIYASIKEKYQTKSFIEQIKISLYAYLKFNSQEDENIKTLSHRIIESYFNHSLISRYTSINLIKNFLKSKISSKFHFVLFCISKILPKPKRLKPLNISNKKTNKNNKNHNNFQIQTNHMHYKTDDLSKFQSTSSPRINKNFSPYSIKKHCLNQENYLSRHNNTFNVNPYNLDDLSFKYIPINKGEYKLKKPMNKNKKEGIIHSVSHSSTNIRTKYDFLSHQVNHIEKVKEKIYNLRMIKQKGIERNCTFSPLINKSRNNFDSQGKYSNDVNRSYDQQPRYIKLNRDFSQRENKIQKIRMKIEKEEKEKNPSFPRNNNYDHILSNNNFSPNCSHKNLYYEKLFKDAKIYQSKKKENFKKQKLEFSFIPSVIKNQKYKVKSSFSERVDKSIEKRIQNINKKEQKSIGRNKKEIELINQNIIERLYKPKIEKIKKKREKEKEKVEELNNKENNFEEQLIQKLKSEHKIKFKYNNSNNQYKNELDKDSASKKSLDNQNQSDNPSLNIDKKPSKEFINQMEQNSKSQQNISYLPKEKIVTFQSKSLQELINKKTKKN